MAAVAPYVDKQTIRVAAPGGKSVGDVSDERKRRDSPVTLCKLLAEPLSDPGRRHGFSTSALSDHFALNLGDAPGQNYGVIIRHCVGWRQSQDAGT
jgi:hypothetical protein